MSEVREVSEVACTRALCAAALLRGRLQVGAERLPCMRSRCTRHAVEQRLGTERGAGPGVRSPGQQEDALSHVVMSAAVASLCRCPAIAGFLGRACMRGMLQRRMLGLWCRC